MPNGTLKPIFSVGQESVQGVLSKARFRRDILPEAIWSLRDEGMLAA